MSAGAPPVPKASKATEATQPTKGTRLGTQIRGEVAEAYNARGKAKSDLGLLYAPKASEDVAVTGLLHYQHYLHSEIDPTIKIVRHTPRREIERLAGLEVAKLIHAQATMHDGRVYWRRLVAAEPDPCEELVAEVSATLGKGVLTEIAGIQTMSQGVLTANPMRLRNSLRVSGWLAGARNWPLADFKLEAFRLVREKGRLTFAQALALQEGPNQALAGAAILELACSGMVGSDLFEVPLHAMTTFTMRGA